jgi:hypothetical protein
MKKIDRMNTLALLGCILLALSGCSRYVVAGAAAGGAVYGTYKYSKGNLSRNYGAPVPTVWEATLSALDQMGIEPAEKNNDAFGGQVNAKLHDGKSLTVKLVRVADNLTEVGVRVGTFGNEERSEFIHNKIAENLKDDAQVEVPSQS